MLSLKQPNPILSIMPCFIQLFSLTVFPPQCHFVFAPFSKLIGCLSPCLTYLDSKLSNLEASTTVWLNESSTIRPHSHSGLSSYQTKQDKIHADSQGIISACHKAKRKTFTHMLTAWCCKYFASLQIFLTHKLQEYICPNWTEINSAQM